MHLSMFGSALGVTQLDNHVMLLTKGDGPDAYAQTFHFQDHPDATDWLHSGKGWQPGWGLLILQAQEKIMSFAVNCAKLLLHDMSDQDLLQGSLQPVLRPAPTNAAGFTSLADMVGETPYRPPESPDFTRIASLLGAKYHQNVYHLALLRQDPGYFAKYMTERKEHSPIMLKDSEGKQHPCLKQENSDQLWSELLKDVIAHEYWNVKVFADLWQQAEALRDLQKTHSAAISTASSLPPVYLEALVQFRRDVWQATQEVRCNMHDVLTASPLARIFFRCEHNEAVVTKCTKCKVSYNLSSSKPMNTVQLYLSCLFDLFAFDEAAPGDAWISNILYSFGIHTIVDAIQRLLYSEPSAKAMITP